MLWFFLKKVEMGMRSVWWVVWYSSLPLCCNELRVFIWKNRWTLQYMCRHWQASVYQKKKVFVLQAFSTCKNTYQKNSFFFLDQNICCEYSKEPSQWDGSFEHLKHMLWVIKRTISMRRFFWAPKTYAKIMGNKNIYNFKLNIIVYLKL